MAGLRIEERESPKPVQAKDISESEWRTRSIQTADRLSKAEQKILELNKTANELRARLAKEKARLDEVSALADQRQVELVKVAAERDELRDRLQPIEELKRKVWEALFA